jgi:hypothetical protein
MRLLDMAVLTLIVAVFVAFVVALASVSWYCHDRAKRQHGDYSSAPGLISDHD